MTGTLTVTLPPLHDKQLVIQRDPRRFKMVRAGRRFGKTKLGVREIVEAGLNGGHAFWVAPTYKLTKPGWRDLKFLANQIPGAEVRRGSMEIGFPGGGEAAIRTAQDPDNLRAEGLDYVVLDEAAYQPEDVWKGVLRPSLVDRRGSALFISTPAGVQGWLYELWHEHENNPDWGLHHYSSYDNPFLDPGELDSLREELGELLFAQEIMGEFVELSGSIIRRAWLKYFSVDSDHYVLDSGERVAKADCSNYITCDPALSTKETADYTVFAVWAKTPDKKTRLLIHVMRVHLEAPDVVSTAADLLKAWDASWIGFEAVAYQAALIQFARREGLPAQALRADKDKVARALPLASQLEAARVQLRAEAAWLPDLERELLMFPNGPFDDQVDALAYGVLDDRVRRKLTAH